MKLPFKYFSFLNTPIAIFLFGLVFTFFVFLLQYEQIQKYFTGPSPKDISTLDSLAVRARDLSRVHQSESLRLTLEVLSRSEQLNYRKGLADSYRLLSINSKQSRNFVLSKEYLEKAQEIYLDLGSDLGLADVEISQGNLLVDLGDTLGAIPHYQEAYTIFSKFDKKDRIRVTAYNLSASYAANQQLDSAIYYLGVSEDLKEQKEDVPGFGVIQSLKGKIAYQKGDFDSAKRFFREALDYHQSASGRESFVAFFESTLLLGRILKEEGELNEAKSLLEESLREEAIYLSEFFARQIFIDLINLYESEGNLKKSNELFWAKEHFEGELERRKVESARNFSAELTLFRGFQLENQALNSRLSIITMVSLLGAVFTLVILLLYLRVIDLNRKNRELKTLLDKSFQIAQIGTFEVVISKSQEIELVEISDIISGILAMDASSDSVEKLKVETLIDLAQQEKLNSIILSYKDKNEFFKEEFDLCNLRNERKVVRVIAKVSSLENEKISLKGILLDITHEHQVLEQTQQNLEKEIKLKELREQLMHMTSHEFRTPLSNISSSIELISLLYTKIPQEDLRLRFKTIVQNARGNINRLVGMLDDLLLYERVQSGEFEVRLEPFDLKPYLEILVSEVKSAKNPDVNVLLMIPEDGLVVQSDKELLEHIFTNLLGNAIKYLDKSLPIEVEVSLEEAWVLLRIKDYGIGIPEKDMVKLFTPFKRASNVAGRQGTGLGLSIVNRMVTKLGGRIEVKSKEGEYSEFRVFLPK
jgi:signal transduction histidine kinase